MPLSELNERLTIISKWVSDKKVKVNKKHIKVAVSDAEQIFRPRVFDDYCNFEVAALPTTKEMLHDCIDFELSCMQFFKATENLHTLLGIVVPPTNHQITHRQAILSQFDTSSGLKPHFADSLRDLDVSINDHLIMSYLELLYKRDESILIWDTLVLTNYMAADSDYGSIEKFVNKKDYNKAKMLLVPWNKNGNHWVLIVVQFKPVEPNVITIYDSIVSPRKENLAAAECVESILCKILGHQADQFVVQPNKKIHRQRDQTSCGLYLMVNAEISSRQASVDYLECHLLGFRIQIRNQLLLKRAIALRPMKVSLSDFQIKIRAPPVYLESHEESDRRWVRNGDAEVNKIQINVASPDEKDIFNEVPEEPVKFNTAESNQPVFVTPMTGEHGSSGNNSRVSAVSTRDLDRSERSVTVKPTTELIGDPPNQPCPPGSSASDAGDDQANSSVCASRLTSKSPKLHANIYSLKMRLREVTGIEPEPLYKIRPGRIDLTAPNCEHRILKAVHHVHHSSHGCHFIIFTDASPASSIAVEFFQIFKLKQAKTKLQEFFTPKRKKIYHNLMPKFIDFIFSEREVPTEFLLSESKQSHEEVNHAKKKNSFWQRIRNLTGLESDPPYNVRSDITDLTNPNCRAKSLLAVTGYKISKTGFDFSLTTEEDPDKTIRVEFFQIFKLRNAKTKLHGYFKENEDTMSECLTRMPSFMNFVFSRQEVPSEFILPRG